MEPGSTILYTGYSDQILGFSSTIRTGFTLIRESRFNGFCWNGSFGCLICFGWFSLIRAENQSPFVFLDC